MKRNGILILSAVLAVSAMLAFVTIRASQPDSEEFGTEPGQAVVGYIGCSNTRETVEGYHRVGGEWMWSYDKRYDAGAVKDWAQDAETGNRYWDIFDELLKENPMTKAVWWQLCIRQEERQTSYEHAAIILEEIRERIPSATVYVSALAEYTDGVCGITGTFGIERAKELARELDSRNDDVLPGPVLGPMTPADTAADGCHLSSPDGKRKLGEQMREFFDEVVAELSEDEEMSIEDDIWQRRIDAALEPTDCTPVPGPDYGDLRYDGPLIDTHYHIPNLPDHPPWEEGATKDDIRPLLGENIKIGDIVCTLEQENTDQVFAFFPVFPEIDVQLLDLADRAMEEHPDNFVPFIMNPDRDNDVGGFPTADAETTRAMLEVHPDLFKGYGEIGLYARQGGAAALSPDSQRLLEIYPVVRKHNLIVYFHLDRGQQEGFEKVLEQNPDINFVWHGDQLIPYEDGVQNLEHIEEILGRHSNAHYTVDELYGDDFLIRPEVTKEQFLAHLENYEELLEEDLGTWKAAIERHPDQFMWGTDRSPQVLWSHDPEVGKALSSYGRAFIARLDPSVQEKFAYRNAQHLIDASGEKE